MADEGEGLVVMGDSSGALGVAIAAGAVLGVQTDTHDVHAALEGEWTSFVTSAVRDFDAFKADWAREQEHTRPTATDIAAVLSRVKSAYRSAASSEKRELLRRALANAFSVGLYRQGLTFRLLGLLEGLEYGDVRILVRLKSGELPGTLDKWPHPDGIVWGQSMNEHHVRQLVAAGLVWTSVHPSDAREWSSGGFGVRLTELGVRMLDLLREPTERT